MRADMPPVYIHFATIIDRSEMQHDASSLPYICIKSLFIETLSDKIGMTYPGKFALRAIWDVNALPSLSVKTKLPSIVDDLCLFADKIWVWIVDLFQMIHACIHLSS